MTKEELESTVQQLLRRVSELEEFVKSVDTFKMTVKSKLENTESIVKDVRDAMESDKTNFVEGTAKLLQEIDKKIQPLQELFDVDVIKELTEIKAHNNRHKGGPVQKQFTKAEIAALEAEIALAKKHAHRPTKVYSVEEVAEYEAALSAIKEAQAKALQDGN